jgi:hypothetical protein
MTKKENKPELKVFAKEMDYWSHPEFILIVAASLEAANQMYSKMGEHERHVQELRDLTEISTLVPAIFVFRPPGDRQMR